MVNSKDFTKRIEKIMRFYELSATAFADQIQVGRSSISHIISGRNKPSLDFVMKVVQTFPEVELYWLLNGKGDFPHRESEKAPVEEQRSSTAVSEEKETERKIKTSTHKKIEKVIVFYTDGTFDAYHS